FAGPHLGDAAFVQDHAAGHLHVVLALPQNALGGFAHDGEGLVLQLVQAFAGFDAIPEGLRHHAQFVVGEGLELGFEGVDLLDLAHEGLDLAVVGGTEKFLGEAEHGRSGSGGRAAEGSEKDRFRPVGRPRSRQPQAFPAVRAREGPRIRSKIPRLGRRRDLSTALTPVNARAFLRRRRAGANGRPGDLSPDPCPERPMRARRPLTSLFLVAAVGLAMGVAACGRGGDEAAPEKNDRVVARVNDRAVWASDVRREAVAQGLIGEDDPLDVSSELFRRVMDEVVDQKLLAAEAERRGLDSSPAAQRRLQAVRERILGDMLVEKVVSGAVSDQAVERLYAEQQRLARTTEEVRVRLILAPTKEQADAVLGVLGQGAAFEAVAAQRSIDDATRYSGGDLGYSTLDVLPGAYASALQGKTPGQVVGPIQTETGWAVLKVEDRRAETPPTLEQARPQIVRYLTYEGVRQLLEQLR